ncbi:MAG TPA: phosphoribosylglycinamide formyltransferase [Tepidisphaeraceae bacterium]|jgi:formyltetrahydrofolate-dependent phosphoribosylglycinamide formyltransferase|nr:phosphoribosylglycinamide formyltransferase [Tepidisphaeraceae bacterium]
MNRIKLAVLVSGAGTTLQNLIDAIAAKDLDAEIRVVVGSKRDVKGLSRASDAKIMNFVVERSAYDDCAEFSKQVFSLCDDADVDLVCLGGWLCLLDIPSTYQGRVINIHPALLPSFGGKGMYGRRVHQAVMDQGCKVSGCTVHFVDATYDTGPIIIQRACPVSEEDTADALAHRVFEEEKIAYPQAVRLFQSGRLRVEGKRVRVLDGDASK